MIILVSDFVLLEYTLLCSLLLACQDCEGCQVFDGFWRVWSGIESKVECLRSTTGFGLEGYGCDDHAAGCKSHPGTRAILRLFVFLFALCLMGARPLRLATFAFFLLFWINFIHFAAFGSSGQLWSTTVHLLRMVTVNNWKIRGVS